MGTVANPEITSAGSDREQRYASSMDLLFAVVVGVVIAVLVVLLGRAGKRAEDYPEPSSQDGKPRFETTMNELRDLREALRSAQGNDTTTRRSL